MSYMLYIQIELTIYRGFSFKRNILNNDWNIIMLLKRWSHFLMEGFRGYLSYSTQLLKTPLDTSNETVILYSYPLTRTQMFFRIRDTNLRNWNVIYCPYMLYDGCVIVCFRYYNDRFLLSDGSKTLLRTTAVWYTRRKCEYSTGKYSIKIRKYW